MLSMPAGTDKTAFELAVGDFLNREYAAFRLSFIPFTTTAIIIMRMSSSDCSEKTGSWLNPRKHHIAQWRQSFASNA